MEKIPIEEGGANREQVKSLKELENEVIKIREDHERILEDIVVKAIENGPEAVREAVKDVVVIHSGLQSITEKQSDGSEFAGVVSDILQKHNLGGEMINLEQYANAVDQYEFARALEETRN